MTVTPNIPLGTVYLVGAGPGDPGLITLRAVECLRRADVVLYDYLVGPAALEHAAASAELVCLGHHSTGRALSPDEIVARMLEEARKGRTVVRLKGGDPSIFGRGADEVGALRGAGVPFEIVPGITTGLAVAAFCEIPITHHEDASAVAFIAGQERHGKAVSQLDYGALARFPGTLVIYMGVKRAERWSRALIEQGKPPETPVAIVRRCSWARQQTVRCTLGALAEVVEERGLCPPAVFVVGKVVDHAPQLSWFAARPLFGTRVLTAAAPRASKKLRRRLASLGADVIAEPAIRISDPADWAPVDAALDRLDQYDWLIFFSPRAADCLLRRFLGRGGDVRRWGCVKLAAAGPGVAERLARHGLQPDLALRPLPGQSLTRRLVNGAAGRRLLLAHAGGGRRALADRLEAAASHADQIVVSRSVDAEDPDPNAAAALASGEIDWVAVASSAAACSVVRLYGDSLRRARLASIGPSASKALRELGYEPAVEACPHTAAGLADAILEAAPAGGWRDVAPCRAQQPVGNVS